MQDISRISQRGPCKEGSTYIPITVRWLEDGTKSCRGGGACGPQQEFREVGMQRGSCAAQYLSRAPGLGVNSLTHHGGLHRRRSVSPSWQYEP